VVNGLVQGVGFRPFVHRLASRLGLVGFVRNQTDGVLIEIEGAPRTLDSFVHHLESDAPQEARLAGLRCAELAVRGEREFLIHDSDVADPKGDVFISPDLATCDDCLRELFDPADRRHHYPFLNCTHCGPRLTIVTGAPYDRERTTMARFALCDACRAEYDDPADRRFHAQPIACPACGPGMHALGGDGARIATADALAYAVERLRDGAIGAIKGVGGYHLACDARNDDAVERLRARKLRDGKPFALMFRDAAAAAEFCLISADERALLESAARPIVLLSRRDHATRLSPAVAPDMAELGVMLPYSPLHHLLLRAIDAPLVMTSGNRSDEPIAFADDDARQRLGAIADFFLVHDRPIHLRADDSVARVVDGRSLWLRRSRGRAPLSQPLPLPLLMPTLALGGQLKSTFALGQGALAWSSHHLGDLDHYVAYREYVAAIEHYQRIFRITPARLVHDLHPDYASTRYATERGIGRLAVQHHHAHFASCLAENGVRGRAIGVIFDGAGLGSDGAVWGGEFLVGDLGEVTRAAHLAYVPMPGGERAMVEPWRMALAHLHHAGLGSSPIAAEVDARELRIVQQLLERRLQSPPTSSMGRLFDAAAAIAGACARASFEGQAAMRLEALAASVAPDGHYPFAIESAAPLVIDPAPIVAALAGDVRRGVAQGRVARRFHSTIVELVTAICRRLADESDVRAVALSGGCFANAILTRECAARLEAVGLRVYHHREVPPNDGGLCLGQLAVVAALDAQAREG
jgi:hydrogenase maturation protein HypF